MMRAVRGTLLALLTVSGAACGLHQARTPTPVMALTMPAPPARLLIPVELPDPPPDPPVTAEVPTPTPSPARPREAAARPAAQPVTPPTTAPVAEAAAPTPVLQTTTQTGPLEQKISALLAAADFDLNKVNYRELGAGARTQYDQARSFIRMAGDALKIKNYMYAESLANKAARVAALLARG